MNWNTYILPMVAVATYVICAIIKPFLGNKSKYLPLIAALCGVIFAFWMEGNLSFATFVAGLVSGFGATGIDQAVTIPMNKPAEVESDDAKK